MEKFFITNPNLGVLWMTLWNELVRIKEKIPDEKGDDFKRTYIRTMFSFIEAISFQIRQVLLLREKKNEIQLSFKDVYILSEKSYDLNERGTINEREKSYPFTRMLKYTFRLYSKIYQKEHVYDQYFSKNGYSKLLDLYKIRNSLTHPKKYSDLSDFNMESAYEVLIWYKDLCSHILYNDLVHDELEGF